MRIKLTAEIEIEVGDNTPEDAIIEEIEDAEGIIFSLSDTLSASCRIGDGAEITITEIDGEEIS